MPARTLVIDGETWQVFPSGFVTPNTGDEFGLLFVRGDGPTTEVRVTRYAPMAATAPDAALAALSDVELRRLFQYAQTSEHSPEAGYRAR